jgi:molybdopterin converting factor small subunit
MKVRVKLFAAAKELAGREELLIDLPQPATIARLRQAVLTTVPALEGIVPHSLWAVGTEYVRDDTELNENSDVALIPPVSGG